MTQPRFLLVMIAVGLLGPGCRRHPPTIATPPFDECSAEVRNGMPRNGMPRNGMPRNGMPRNGLSAAALADNWAALDHLRKAPFAAGVSTITVPANDTTDLGPLLHYVASCALDPCETVPLTGSDPLVGGLGLCGDTYAAWAADQRAKGNTALPDEGTWRSGPASAGCQQRVTACVLARVNAIQAAVRISMRGDATSLAAHVPTDTLFRESDPVVRGTGTPVQSFLTCAARKLSGADPARNCDWAPRYVGQCVRGPSDQHTAGAQVHLTLPPGLGRVRVCAGLHGCDDVVAHDTTPLYDRSTKQAVDYPPRYGGTMITSVDASKATTLEFACPWNGPELTIEPGGPPHDSGYYALMVDASADADLDVALVAPAPHHAYPAAEVDVFTYREGAFYGTLFEDQQPIPPELNQGVTLAYDQHACWSSMWKDGLSLLTARFCADPKSPVDQCFFNPPVACEPTTTAPGACTPIADATQPRVEDTCGRLPNQETAGWEPYTTYLNHPCDLLSETACQQVRDVEGNRFPQ